MWEVQKARTVAVSLQMTRKKGESRILGGEKVNFRNATVGLPCETSCRCCRDGGREGKTDGGREGRDYKIYLEQEKENKVREGF